jgi:hypothetical protein
MHRGRISDAREPVPVHGWVLTNRAAVDAMIFIERDAHVPEASAGCDWKGVCEAIEGLQQLVDARGIDLRINGLVSRLKLAHGSDYGTLAVFQGADEALRERGFTIVQLWTGGDFYHFAIEALDAPVVTSYVDWDAEASDHQPEDLF